MHRPKQWKSLAATSPFSSVQTPNMENLIYLNEYKWWTVTSAASTLATAECREQEGVEKARRNKTRQRGKQWKWSHGEWRTRQEEMQRVIEEQIGASGPRREKHPRKKQTDRQTERAQCLLTALWVAAPVPARLWRCLRQTLGRSERDLFVRDDNRPNIVRWQIKPRLPLSLPTSPKEVILHTWSSTYSVHTGFSSSPSQR